VSATDLIRFRTPSSFPRESALAMSTTLTEVQAEAGLTRMRTEVLELKPVPAICVLAQKA
jgi:hypothetical protein